MDGFKDGSINQKFPMFFFFPIDFKYQELLPCTWLLELFTLIEVMRFLGDTNFYVDPNLKYVVKDPCINVSRVSIKSVILTAQFLHG